MKFLIAALKIFGVIWVFLALVLIVVSLIFVWMNSGFSEVQKILSPFNLINWLVTVITFAPGVAAIVWAGKLSEKTNNLNNTNMP